MVERISTAGILIRNIDTLQHTQSLLDKRSFRVSSGQQHQNLRDYRSDAYRLVEFRQESFVRKSYERNIELTQSMINSYNVSLEQLAKDASDLISAASVHLSVDDSVPTTNDNIANNLLLDIEAVLNTEFGGRFIFGGTNYDDPPLRDLRNFQEIPVTDLKTDVSLLYVNGNDPTLPYYRIGVDPITGAPDAASMTRVARVTSMFSETYFTDTINATAASEISPVSLSTSITRFHFDRTTVRVSDERSVDYNINATDPAFNKLIYAALNLRASAQSPDSTTITIDERREFLNRADKLATEALREIRELQTEVSRINDDLNDYKQIHTSFQVIVQQTVDEIEGADTATAATELSVLSNLLNASYSVIAKQNQLSILNYLK